MGQASLACSQAVSPLPQETAGEKGSLGLGELVHGRHRWGIRELPAAQSSLVLLIPHCILQIVCMYVCVTLENLCANVLSHVSL